MGKGGHAEFVKPQSCKLHYGSLVLDNGLQAVVIRDEKSDKSSAALDVSFVVSQAHVFLAKHPTTVAQLPLRLMDSKREDTKQRTRQKVRRCGVWGTCTRFGGTVAQPIAPYMPHRAEYWTWGCLLQHPLTRKGGIDTQHRLVLQVHVGSMSDPVELPGLAHFLEHMLFYANSKYPEEDAYSKFIVCLPSSRPILLP